MQACYLSENDILSTSCQNNIQLSIISKARQVKLYLVKFDYYCYTAAILSNGRQMIPLIMPN